MRPSLFEPIQLGEIACANRTVMAPMTRNRADHDDSPSQLHVRYYGERASAGLIVTEGTHPSIHGKGYARTPGMQGATQVNAWRRVVEAVHAAGGHVVLQLMHVGRIASRYNKHPQARTVAPSPIKADVKLHTDTAGLTEVDMPEALSTQEIAFVIEEYAAAARLAREAGFDGVELHATSGYLPMQFLAVNSNQRTDAYGGSATRRARFVIEVLEALSASIGASRVGLRIGIGNPYNDVIDPDPTSTYASLLDGIRGLRLAYLHVLREQKGAASAFALARAHFAGPLIANDGFDPHTAKLALATGVADAISFGRHYIANPDLVRRLREELPLAPFDRKTLYTPGPQGYIDYSPAP